MHTDYIKRELIDVIRGINSIRWINGKLVRPWVGIDEDDDIQ